MCEELNGLNDENGTICSGSVQRIATSSDQSFCDLIAEISRLNFSIKDDNKPLKVKAGLVKAFFTEHINKPLSFWVSLEQRQELLIEMINSKLFRWLPLSETFDLFEKIAMAEYENEPNDQSDTDLLLAHLEDKILESEKLLISLIYFHWIQPEKHIRQIIDHESIDIEMIKKTRSSCMNILSNSSRPYNLMYLAAGGPDSSVNETIEKGCRLLLLSFNTIPLLMMDSSTPGVKMVRLIIDIDLYASPNEKEDKENLENAIADYFSYGSGHDETKYRRNMYRIIKAAGIALLDEYDIIAYPSASGNKTEIFPASFSFDRQDSKPLNTIMYKSIYLDDIEGCFSPLWVLQELGHKGTFQPPNSSDGAYKSFVAMISKEIKPILDGINFELESSDATTGRPYRLFKNVDGTRVKTKLRFKLFFPVTRTPAPRKPKSNTLPSEHQEPE